MIAYMDLLCSTKKPKRLHAQPPCIKQVIPCDSLTANEERQKDVKERRIRETFAVKTKTGHTAERISRKVKMSDTTINYLGMNRKIQGEGFARFITL